MVRCKETNERDAQRQGKLRRIQEHTDWLLESESPWFSQQALHKVVERGGWEVDPANEKQRMRNYLVSIDRNTAEPEERRERARMLMQKIDAHTGINRQIKSWRKTMAQRTGKVQVGIVGGIQNRSDRFAPWESCAPGPDCNWESAIGERSLGDFERNMDNNNPSALHTVETERYGGAFGQQPNGSSSKEGVFTCRSSSSQIVDTDLEPQLGMPAGPSLPADAFSAGPRQILGELPMNSLASLPQKALQCNEQAPPLKPALSKAIETTWPGDDKLKEGERRSGWASRHGGRECTGLGRGSGEQSERKRKEPGALHGAGSAQHTGGVPGLAPGEFGAGLEFTEWKPRAADYGSGQASRATPRQRVTSPNDWRPRSRTPHSHSWQPEGYQAGAELCAAFGDGREYEPKGHSAYDEDPAGDRVFEGAWDVGQAKNESGKNVGRRLKRRRDDVASDVEPRAKRGGDDSGFNNWRIQSQGPVSVRVEREKGNTAKNNYYINYFYGGRNNVH